MASMRAYYPSSAAHSHLTIPAIPTTSMLAYYPSTAAHTHLDISTPPTTETPPPSPTAAELIASLQDPENLSDEDLQNATLRAQQSLHKWQDEYLANDRDIRRATTGLLNNANKPKARQLQTPEQYELSLNKAADEAMNTHETSSRGRKLTKTANASSSQPKKQPLPKTRKPKAPKTKGPQPPKPAPPIPSKRKAPSTKVPKPPPPTIASAPKPEKQPEVTIPKDLLIDMNGPQPAQAIGKRTRKPRKIFDSPPAAAPKVANTRAATPSIATKKRARSVAKDEDEAAPPPAKKRAVVKREQTPGAAARSKGEVMREVWAKRKAEGRNGRHGGAPKAATVAKARVKGGV